MPIRPLVGLTVRGVYRTNSDFKNYARYFITTDDGSCFEVKVGGFELCRLPAGAHRSLETDFRDILGKSKIKDIRTDDQTDLAILLDSGHLMLMGGTFNGVDTGNNFYLESPAEAAEGSAGFSELRQVTHTTK